jgi:hypothetical protein
MSSWVYDVIGSTNRIARLTSGGQAYLPLRAQAAAASELCTTYWKLLLDPEFKRHIEESVEMTARGIRDLQRNPDLNELRCHANQAVALLVEAGLDGKFALDEVRSVQDALSELVGAFRGGKSKAVWTPVVETAAFFRLLRDAQEAVCDLSGQLRTEAISRESRFKLWKAELATAGLGLVGTPAAVIGEPALAVGAGVGAMMNVIGSTMFQHNTHGLKEPT